ncbi:MAG: lysophospholipid acyltransferase family protein [Spirochaetota bacterium]
MLWILYQPYKWLFLAPVVCLLTLITGSLAAILVFIVNPRTASMLTGVQWARIIAFITPMFVRVTGRENIDPEQSYVIVSNHQSQYDILLLYGRLNIDFRWVMKQELRKIPGLGIACERLGHIFIDRSNSMSAVASLKAAKKKIVSGTSVMFFPEGTRSKDGNIGVFKKGAFKMALDLGVPVLPVTIIGTRNILPTHSLDVFPGKVKMIIHKPVDVSEYSNDIQALIEQVRKIIISSTIK